MKKILIVLALFITAVLVFAGESSASSHGEYGIRQTHEKLRGEVKSILSDKRFAYVDRFRWLRQAWEKINRFLRGLFPEKPKKEISRSWLNAILEWLGVAFLFALPFLAVYYVKVFFQREKPVKAGMREQSDNNAKSCDLQAKAEAMAGKEEFREAVRYIYLACLAYFKEKGMLPQSTRLTDKENLKILRKTSGETSRLYLAFFRLVFLFQEKWYGLKVCRADDYRQAKELTSMIFTGKERINVQE